MVQQGTVNNLESCLFQQLRPHAQILGPAYAASSVWTAQGQDILASVSSLLLCGPGYKIEEGPVNRGGHIVVVRGGSKNSKPQNSYNKWKAHLELQCEPQHREGIRLDGATAYII